MAVLQLVVSWPLHVLSVKILFWRIDFQLDMVVTGITVDPRLSGNDVRSSCLDFASSGIHIGAVRTDYSLPRFLGQVFGSP